MDSAKQLEPLGLDELTALENRTEQRYELIGGQVFAMTGGTDVHNLIIGGLAFALRQRLRGGSCKVFTESVKLRVGRDFYYPDVFVSCSGDDNQTLYKSQPVFIAEVLSDSSLRRDRFERRVVYQQIVTLKDYLIIAQETVHIEHWQCIETHWQVKTLALADEVELGFDKLTIPLKEIYFEVLDIVA